AVPGAALRLLRDGIERAALHERLERAAVEHVQVDALREVLDRREGAAFLARADDALRGGVADVLHRAEPEADARRAFNVLERERDVAAVHVRRADVDAEPHALG